MGSTLQLESLSSSNCRKLNLVTWKWHVECVSSHMNMYFRREWETMMNLWLCVWRAVTSTLNCAAKLKWKSKVYGLLPIHVCPFLVPLQKNILMWSTWLTKAAINVAHAHTWKNWEWSKGLPRAKTMSTHYEELEKEEHLLLKRQALRVIC